MAPSKNRESRTVRDLRRTAGLLAEMLAHTAAETRRLQKQEEAALGRRYADRAELHTHYKPGEMKDLTALLKDVTAVSKSLEEHPDDTVAGGVVILPAAGEGDAHGTAGG